MSTPQKMSGERMMDLLKQIAESFSPSAPIDQKALFAGRIDQFVQVINAISQKGQHVILYGERGVGKTSLATVIAQLHRGQAHVMGACRINCDQTMDFTALWRTALREIPISSPGQLGIGFTSSQSIQTNTLADYLPPVVTPDDIRHLLQRIGKTIIVFDELDRIEDKKTATLMADTVKTLSDHAVNTTLILVGVADSVETLIEEHQSVERALVQIRMPRMNQVELTEIIEKGANNSHMTIDSKASKRIVALSQGLPQYVHSLSLHAFQHAAQRLSSSVSISDVREAINRALNTAQQTTISTYHRATSSPRENLYPQVLLACAMAKPDDMGYFAAADVRAPLSLIMGRPYEINAFSQHLNAFCDPDRGPVLQRLGLPRRYRFRFLNPLMQPYVTMHGVDKGMISDAALE